MYLVAIDSSSRSLLAAHEDQRIYFKTLRDGPLALFPVSSVQRKLVPGHGWPVVFLTARFSSVYRRGWFANRPGSGENKNDGSFREVHHRTACPQPANR